MADRNAYLERINSYVKPDFEIEKKFFQVRESVKNKVDTNNGFKNYYGDTTVFDLNRKDKEWFSSVISKLYEEVPECFCERLNENTLHITLHDLSSSSEYAKVKDVLSVNEAQINQISNLVKVAPMNIRMRTRYIANILNISLVYVLCPVNQEEYLKLMTLYHLIDAVQELEYKYTPHITLGYFNINGFDVSSVIKLENIVRELNKESHEFTISTDQLFYQHFESMNNYRNICKIVK